MAVHYSLPYINTVNITGHCIDPSGTPRVSSLQWRIQTSISFFFFLYFAVFFVISKNKWSSMDEFSLVFLSSGTFLKDYVFIIFFPLSIFSSVSVLYFFSSFLAELYFTFQPSLYFFLIIYSASFNLLCPLCCFFKKILFFYV